MVLNAAPTEVDASGHLLTYAEACAYVRLSRWSLIRAIQAGRLKHVRFGKAVRFRRADLDEWVAQHVLRRI